jgi:hypothetical protein
MADLEQVDYRQQHDIYGKAFTGLRVRRGGLQIPQPHVHEVAPAMDAYSQLHHLPPVLEGNVRPLGPIMLAGPSAKHARQCSPRFYMPISPGGKGS